MSRENVELVRRINEAFNRGDFRTLGRRETRRRVQIPGSFFSIA